MLPARYDDDDDSNNSYTSVVLHNSKVIFLQKEKDATFHSFLYCFSLIYGVALSNKSVIKFHCLPDFT